MATGADVIRQGRKYLGVPYKLDGRANCSRSAMYCDCFTKITYNDVGIRLGWWTQQLNYGTQVKLSNRRPGDLLFFSGDGSGKLTHVGIQSYNGNLLHASSYFGEVVESELKYIRGLFEARRLTGPQGGGKYARAIGNGARNRFRGPSGWWSASIPGQNGNNHRRARPDNGRAAWFKFDIPRTATYNVYIWHPSAKRLNPAMPFGIYSPSHRYADGSGMVWKRVNLRTGGGRWKLLGRYRIPAGDRWVAACSRWVNRPGLVVADAVRITSV